MGTRQLATVVFADIAGYTALMQRNESEAMSMRRRFREVLEEQVAKYEGRVIQYYGDGCLSIFDSGKLAVAFAVEVQKSFKTHEVPVRMGMHLGDITVDEEGAYGDAVNIAARVESFAVTGAIFMSRKVYDQIRNQPEIQCTSLGNFEMKNVSVPVELYAVSGEGFPVPDISTLKGKGTRALNSIAVLAFTNMSADPEQDFFGDGIAEEIINVLVKIPDLKVAGRTSSFSFKGREMDLRELGNQLGVKNVLEGSVRKAGNLIRVTAQLISVKDGFHLWSERYDRELEDIFAIQDDIANKISEKLKVTLLSKANASSVVPTNNIEAYQWYLRGRYQLDQRSLITQAQSCFERAREIDPNYARAWSGMAYTHFYHIFFGGRRPRDTFPLVRESALKARALDPSLAEAALMEGLVSTYFDWDFVHAETCFQEAIQLAPRSFDVYRVKAYFHSLLAEREESLELIGKVSELDPLNVNVRLSVGELLYRAYKYEEAIETMNEFLNDFPNHGTAHFILAESYHKLKDELSALNHLERALQFLFAPSFYSFNIPSIYAQMGRFEKAREVMSALETKYSTNWISPVTTSLLHFSMGETLKAEQYLQTGLEERDPILLVMNVDPLWDDYRQLESVQEVLRKIGLIPG